MEEQSKKKKRSKHLTIVIQLVIGGAFGFFAGIYLVKRLFANELSIIDLVQIVVFLYLSIFVNINIHELGHFFFGRLFGYSLISYRISMFTWNNENGRMRFKILKNKGYGGLCAMLPPKQELPSFKSCLFYAGGIIFNAAFGVVLLALVLLMPKLHSSLSSFMTITGGLSLILGLINFLPFVSENNPTDGKIIWSLILKKPFAKKLIEMNKMISQLSAGIRPRELSIAIDADMENPQLLDVMTEVYQYFKSLDSFNIDEVICHAELLEKNLDAFPHHTRHSIYYELCYVSCITGNKEKAMLYYERAGKLLQGDKDINGLRVKAYYEYYILNNTKAALKLCENALAVADRYPIKGQGLMEKDLVLNLRSLISEEK